MRMGTHEHELEIELLLRHRAWLRALAARLVGPGLADDLAQETWVAALRRPPDPARPAKPWLAAVAKRLALRLRGRTETGALGPEGEAPSTDELLERVELEARLAREVARLAEPFRRTVLLRYHEGLSAAAIARRDGVPAGTVRWRLKRGLDELRGRLDREFGDRKSWAALLEALAGVEGAVGGAVAGWVKIAGAAALAAALVAGGARWLPEAGGPEAAPPLGRVEAQLAAAPTPEAELAAEHGAAQGEARREVEGSAPAVAQATARGLSFEIVEWDGKPGADILVALRKATGFIAGAPEAARTDASGRVAFPDAEGLVKVVVERSGQPYRLELQADGREHRLELPRGALVSGRVTVGGEVPQEPVVLELYRAEELQSLWVNEFTRLDSLFGDDPVLRTSTDSAGAFAFAGLEDDWRGVLRPRRGYVARGHSCDSDGGSRMVFLDEPTEKIELDLDRCPRLYGRVVDQDGVQPVPYAILTLQPVENDGMSVMFGAGADFDGRFEVFPEEREFRTLWVEVKSYDQLGRAEYTFARSEVSTDGNLGDLRLGRGRSVTLHVVDPTGMPIEGALISRQGRASEACGELVVSGLPLEEGTFWIAARGYAGTQVKVPADVQALEVVLAPANAIELIVRDRAGRPLDGVDVEVATEGPAFISNPRGVRGPDELTRDAFAGTYDWTRYESTRDGPTQIHFRADADGRVTLSALQPGAPLGITVRSPCFSALCEKRIEAPGAGERLTVALGVMEELHTFALRVVDQQGDPVSRADVELALSVRDTRWRHYMNGRTDAQGRIEIPRLVRATYLLEVSKSGYLPVARDGLQLQEEELVLVLERGLDVSVHVKDAAGNAVPGGRITCNEIGEAKESEAGRIDLRGLPDQPVELTLYLGGARYGLHLDPRQGDVEIVLPEHGSAVVRWAQPPGADWSDFMRVLLVPEDGSQPPVEWTVANTPDGEWTFPVVATGAYQAVLVRDGESEDEVYDLTQRARIEVRAGETARVELVPLAVPARR